MSAAPPDDPMAALRAVVDAIKGSPWEQSKYERLVVTASRALRVIVDPAMVEEVARIIDPPAFRTRAEEEERWRKVFADIADIADIAPQDEARRGASIARFTEEGHVGRAADRLLAVSIASAILAHIAKRIGETS